MTRRSNDVLARSMHSHVCELGTLLKRWRRLRGLSQLDLALEADVSARHLSFVETGRSQPSRELVVRLAQQLTLGMRDTNALLEAAGFSPEWPERALTDEALADVRAVVQQMLETHMPMPAFAIDRLWNVVATNATAALVFASVGGQALPNVVDFFYGSTTGRALIANLDDVARAARVRLRRELASRPLDAELAALVARLEGYTSEIADDADAPDGATICPVLQLGGQQVHTIGVMAQLTSVADVTIDELRVELFYPGDAHARAFFEALASRG